MGKASSDNGVGQTASFIPLDHRVDPCKHVDDVSPFASATLRSTSMSLPDFNVFSRHATPFPWRSDAIWFLTQTVRWGQIDQPIDFHKVATQVYRPDLYRIAANEPGIAFPSIDMKSGGMHAAPWSLTDASNPIPMGSERFFDGGKFDPARPLEYLSGFRVHNLKLALDALTRAHLQDELLEFLCRRQAKREPVEAT